LPRYFIALLLTLAVLPSVASIAPLPNPYQPEQSQPELAPAGAETLYGRYQYDGVGNLGILQFADGGYYAYA
jgi:hypothetical protein